MKRASYREAINWLASYDDNEWLKDTSPIMSVSAALVSDIFGVDEARVMADIRRMKAMLARIEYLEGLK